MNGSTHDDAASALMALAANSKNGDDASIMEEAMDTGGADTSSKAGSSTPSSNRFPEKVSVIFKFLVSKVTYTSDRIEFVIVQ